MSRIPVNLGHFLTDKLAFLEQYGLHHWWLDCDEPCGGTNNGSYATDWLYHNGAGAAWPAAFVGSAYPQVIPPVPFLVHSFGHISPISPPFFLVFCAFSPSRRDGSNEPQAGIQGQETAGKSSRVLPPSFDTPDA